MLLQRLRQAQIVPFLGVRGSASRLRSLILRHPHVCVAVRSAIFDFGWRRPSCRLACAPFRNMRSAANGTILDLQDVKANERTVFIGGLKPLSDEYALEKHFSSFGAIEGCSIVRTIRGASKCFGFVRFRDGGMIDEVLKQEHVIGEAPVDVYRAKKYRIVHIGSLPSNVMSEHLAEHFSKFGAVERVQIPERANQRRGYGLVTFSTQGEASRATEEEKHTIQLGEEGAKAELEVKLYELAKNDVQSNRLLVNGLPYETTAEELGDFFGENGSLKAVDLALNTNLRKCVAFLTFEEDEEVHDLASKGEVLFNGVKVLVHKADIQAKLQVRYRSIFVDSLPLGITEDELTMYFMTFGNVRRVSLPLDKGTNQHMGFGVVKFMKSTDVKAVLDYGPHVIGTQKIGVRRLALVLPSSRVQPVAQNSSD